MKYDFAGVSARQAPPLAPPITSLRLHQPSEYSSLYPGALFLFCHTTCISAYCTLWPILAISKFQPNIMRSRDAGRPRQALDNGSLIQPDSQDIEFEPTFPSSASVPVQSLPTASPSHLQPINITRKKCYCTCGGSGVDEFLCRKRSVSGRQVALGFGYFTFSLQSVVGVKDVRPLSFLRSLYSSSPSSKGRTKL